MTTTSTNKKQDETSKQNTNILEQVLVWGGGKRKHDISYMQQNGNF